MSSCRPCSATTPTAQADALLATGPRDSRTRARRRSALLGGVRDPGRHGSGFRPGTRRGRPGEALRARRLFVRRPAGVRDGAADAGGRRGAGARHHHRHHHRGGPAIALDPDHTRPSLGDRQHPRQAVPGLAPVAGGDGPAVRMEVGRAGEAEIVRTAARRPRRDPHRHVPDTRSLPAQARDVDAGPARITGRVSIAAMSWSSGPGSRHSSTGPSPISAGGIGSKAQVDVRIVAGSHSYLLEESHVRQVAIEIARVVARR